MIYILLPFPRKIRQKTAWPPIAHFRVRRLNFRSKVNSEQLSAFTVTGLSVIPDCWWEALGLQGREVTALS